MKLLYHLQWEGAAIAPLQDRHPDVSFVVSRSAEQTVRELADADILVVAGPYYRGEVARAAKAAAPKLRWIQTTSIGVDRFEEAGLPDGVVFTNAAGLKGRTVAEHTIALLLAQLHAVPQMERARAAGHWARDALRSQVSSAEGRRLLLLGYGSIGQEVARKAKAFDMEVVALNRSGDGGPPADVVAPVTAVGEWLPKADFVVCTLPLTAETRHLLGRQQLAAMKPEALLVNVGRGPVVDQAALAEALEKKRIAGACLDVFDAEPLPPGDPLWRQENLVLSPHVAGTGGPQAQRFAELVSENLSRFTDGRPLINEVKLGAPQENV
ncbi:MAG: phosphoglycerate dehydrogenase [Kiloniellaceae bacterium]